MEMLQGTIVNQDSQEPISKAKVLLNKKDAFSHDIAQETNLHGFFKYPNLSHGYYTIEIVHDDFFHRKLTVFYNGGMKRLRVNLERKLV